MKCGGIEFELTKGITDVAEGKGIYLIIDKPKEPKDSLWDILYIGQTKSFKERITYNHEKYDCWEKNSDVIYHGLYFMSNSTEDERKKIEEKLISNCNTKCNDT